jgi:pantoate--beta-alanine ligase
MRRCGVRIIRSLKEMSNFSHRVHARAKTIGFVPTMGALHEGHLSLMRQAHKENDTVVVSIFVNPAQFGPREDFKKYPRNLNKDAKLCQKEGVDIIFYPASKDIYPISYKTYVAVEDLSNVLCGKFRPGHFRGVATIVTKLFNIVGPDIAYFGQKDAQQAIIIKKMVEDLNMPLRIKVMPTMRQIDGLAMSSRNAYLDQKEKDDAIVLSKSLNLARKLISEGKRNVSDIIRRMRELINQKKSAKIQYISIVDPQDLKPIEIIKGRVLIALAVYIGKTRLIDNVIVNC